MGTPAQPRSLAAVPTLQLSSPRTGAVVLTPTQAYSFQTPQSSPTAPTTLEAGLGL